MRAETAIKLVARNHSVSGMCWRQFLMQVTDELKWKGPLFNPQLEQDQKKAREKVIFVAGHQCLSRQTCEKNRQSWFPFDGQLSSDLIVSAYSVGTAFSLSRGSNTRLSTFSWDFLPLLFLSGVVVFFLNFWSPWHAKPFCCNLDCAMKKIHIFKIKKSKLVMIFSFFV